MTTKPETQAAHLEHWDEVDSAIVHAKNVNIRVDVYKELKQDYERVKAERDMLRGVIKLIDELLGNKIEITPQMLRAIIEHSHQKRESAKSGEGKAS